jgi:hypothetical protein
VQKKVSPSKSVENVKEDKKKSEKTIQEIDREKLDEKFKKNNKLN